MKKTIGAAIATVILLTGANAFAAERNLTDAANGVVKISGTAYADAMVSVLITNPGYTYENAAQNGARQYMQSFKANADGSYEHNIVLNMDTASSGYFKIYVKEGNAEIVELQELYFASVDQKFDEMKKVIANTSLIGTDETVKNVFGLNETLYTSVDMSAVSAKLTTWLAEHPIDVKDDDTNEEKLEKFGILSKAIKEISVIEAYNAGKSEVLFNSSNEFEYEDVLRLSMLDSDKNVTVYALYKNSLNDIGRANVRNAMQKNKVQEIAQLQRIFARSVMFNGIENHKEQGYGHISNYLTAENIRFATNVIGNTEADTYLNLQNKTNANYTIKAHASEMTLDNFLSKIEYYAANPESPYSKPSGGSGSSGGSSSGKGLTISIPADSLVKNDENTKPSESNKPIASGFFSDVYDDFWGKAAIEYLYKKGVISGMTENTFGPNDNLTREQAVKILCTAFDITDIKDLYSENGVTYDYTDYTMFDDVTQYDWYGEYVFAAYRNGVVKGVSDRLFGVGTNVTRQDIAAMIYRAMKATASGETSMFDDAAEIADYAVDAVSYMKSNRIIEGYKDNTFRPNNFITRAEMAQIVYKILNKEG